MVKRTVTRTQIRHFLVILAGIGMGQISIISGSDMAVSFSSNHLDSNQAISISSFHTLPAFTYIEEVFVQLDKEILLTMNSKLPSGIYLPGTEWNAKSPASKLCDAAERTPAGTPRAAFMVHHDFLYFECEP